MRKIYSLVLMIILALTLTLEAQAEYVITANATMGGTIAPNGIVNVVSGANQTFAITADKNYEVFDVVVDGVSAGNITSYNFTNVLSNHTIRVEFVSPDTDGDGLTNAEEAIYHTEDGVNSHPVEGGASDSDHDGLDDYLECKNTKNYGTSALNDDTDEDGILDGDEVNASIGSSYVTDPIKADTDGDGFNDRYEIKRGTDPTSGSSHPLDDMPYIEIKTDSPTGSPRLVGKAPFAVFFDASESVPADDSRKIIRYQWNFNDPGSSNLPKVVKGFDHNYAQGVVAAHIFDPGFIKKGPNGEDISSQVDGYGFFVGPGDLVYHVELIVTDAIGRQLKQTVNITVKPFTGNTYFVSSDGLDSNNGTTENSPWKTALYAFNNNVKIVKSGDRVLFKRGDAFTFEYSLQPRTNVTYGAYGPGERQRPLFTTAMSGGSALYTLQNLSNITVQDLQFDLLFKSSGASSYQNVYNVLYLRLRFEHYPNTVIGANGPADRLSGFFIQDTEIQHGNSVAMYFIASRVAFLNSVVTDAGNHVFYNSYLNKAVFSGNYIARPAYGRHFRLAASNASTNGPTNNVVICDNIFDGGIDTIADKTELHGDGRRYTWALVHLGPNVGGLQRMKNVYFERNIVRNAQSLLFLGGGYSHLKIANNIFESKSATGSSALTFGNHFGSDSLGNRDVSILSNTFIVNDAAATINIPNYPAASSVDNVNHQKIKLFNNIFVSQNTVSGSARAIAISSALLKELESDNNLFYYSKPNIVSIDGVGKTFDSWKMLGKDTSSSYGKDPFFTAFDGIRDDEFSHVAGTDYIIKAQYANQLYVKDDLQFDLYYYAGDNLIPDHNQGSVAIDGGRTLESVKEDFSKNSRPQGNAYDIGAYEYLPDQALVLFGDVDGSGKLNVADAFFLIEAIVSKRALSDQQHTAADVSNDGFITAYDAALIIQKVIGFIQKFPVES